MKKIVIIGAKRTPIGALMGQFSQLSATQLGAIATKAAMQQANIAPEKIDWVIMGNVLGAGIGQAPARQVALKSGLPISVQATTVNKVCGSGMMALFIANNALLAGEIDFAISGGMESMTNAPHLIKNFRKGQKFGHGQIYDHMAFDGLEDAYEGLAMGVYGELAAREYGFCRSAQDDYAIETLEKAKAANFAFEIAPVNIPSRTENIEILTDELVQTARIDKIRNLKPAFDENGTISAANASGISDGAASLVLTTYENAIANNCEILANIIATACFAHEPKYFTTAPVFAIQKALAKANWKIEDVDLWEINEAFAIVPMIAMQDLGIKREKLNVNGGACALGHPIGASGARIITTLIYALKSRGLKKGIAAICIGGGEACAICIELDSSMNN
jgi:acetyl-CoA C-acetyltransferase